MFKTLRMKLVMGFLPSLAIMVGLGLWAIVMFYRLGGNIEVILRENYRSVLAAEQMKESLERMDSGLLFATSGRYEQARNQFENFRIEFEKQLKLEQGNVTLPGEQEFVDELTAEYKGYINLAGQFLALQAEPSQRRVDFYFTRLLPTFDRIKSLANSILLINQRNMETMDLRARTYASNSIRLMIVALLVSIVLTVASARILTRVILEPILAVTDGARAVARGRLDQVVPATTRDELGELGVAFNTMARTIREYREAGTARLLRAQKTAQATIDSFPDPVVLVDPEGAVEQANPAAQRLLQAIPSTNGSIPWVPPVPLRPHLEQVLQGREDYLPLALDQAIFIRDGSRDLYFLPRVLSIRGESGVLLGAAVVLSDVTRLHLVDQLKSDMISTVSHELKTPLTSLQMAVHLLLEEVVGPLTPKQTELLLTARQDSDRLLAMINDLLDMTRLEQGRIALNQERVPPADLIKNSIERFKTQAEDQGIRLNYEIESGLTPVLVDQERIEHVFDNLLSNALRHSERGGVILIRAVKADTGVCFSVEDTGEGIPPEELPHIFDKFYHNPASRHAGGSGLGLSIAREILSAHDCRIQVESEPGKVTRFSFTLPAPSVQAGSSESRGNADSDRPTR